jgi:hypothetical protein
MSDTAEILHHVPGRLRLRVSSAKGDAPRVRALQQALGGAAGVDGVHANPVLGTILIRYDPRLFAEFPGALQAYALEHDLFEFPCSDDAPCISAADRSVDRLFGDINRKVQTALGNTINLKELLPLMLGAYGLFFVDRTAAAAQWLNWIQVAFDTYIDLHEDEPVTVLRQKMDALGARILDQQLTAAESLKTELTALRAEVRELAERLETPRTAR